MQVFFNKLKNTTLLGHTVDAVLDLGAEVRALTHEIFLEINDNWVGEDIMSDLLSKQNLYKIFYKKINEKNSDFKQKL